MHSYEYKGKRKVIRTSGAPEICGRCGNVFMRKSGKAEPLPVMVFSGAVSWILIVWLCFYLHGEAQICYLITAAPPTGLVIVGLAMVATANK